MKKITITIPPKKKISFMIPLVEDWEVDEQFYDFVYDKKTDSVLSWILEIFLKEYIPLKWWVFKVNDNKITTKYDSVNFEKFQAMKDIIMGRFRITPIKIPISKDWDDVKYYDWEIGSNNWWVEYEYKWKKYKTNHFWLYVSNFRREMFVDSDDYDFYGGHSLQYRQRIKRFESWYVTYTNACRWLGKSVNENFDIATDFIRETVFRWERARPFLNLYYWPTKQSVATIFKYTLNMYKALLISIWWEKLFKKLLHYDKTNQILTLHDWTNDRQIMSISENQSARGSRPSMVIVDEMVKFKNADEIMDEVAGFGKCPISVISTVKSDTIRNVFYENRALAYRRMNKYDEDMFDIVHDIRWKYWFGTCEKPEDYLELAKQWVFDKARTELFTRRELVWLKFTIDDGELKTEEEKNLDINGMMNQSWYGGVMAEFYGVILTDRSVFKTSWNVIERLPHEDDKVYQHMYFSYDEADEWDNPAVVVWWIYEWKLYIVESVKLTADLTKRYEDMQQLYVKRKYKTLGWINTIIADVNRGVTIREKMIEKLWKLDVPFIFTRTAAKEDYNIKDGKHIVNKWRLVKLLQNEYLPKWKVFVWANMDNEWWLLEEMANFVDKGNGKFEWDKKEKDDQVCALLQIIYAAHIWFFKWIRDLWYHNLDNIEVIKRQIDTDKLKNEYTRRLKERRRIISSCF